MSATATSPATSWSTRGASPAISRPKLVSQKLVFADLAPLVGAPPGKPGGNVSPQQRQTQQQLEATGDLFPNVPLKVEKLRAMNMDVTLDAKRVIAPAYLPVQALSFHVVVQDGVATAKPLTLILLGDGQSAGAGKIAGELVVAAKTDTPKVRTRLVLSDIELRNFFRGSRYFDATYGKVQGRVVLAGTGRSLAQVLTTANGYVAAAMAGGSVSSLMVSLSGLQIFDALILYVTGDNRIPIKCAVGRLNFNDGTVTFDRTLLDTQKSVLHVQGQASLITQAVKTEIDANAKQFDLLDLFPDPYAGSRHRQGRTMRASHPAVTLWAIVSRQVKGIKVKNEFRENIVTEAVMKFPLTFLPPTFAGKGRRALPRAASGAVHVRFARRD
ncbi:AsmA family protein [Rhodospirillales bacterium URHD0017]|nr:AsmA family protein [Rhodospirillales bacterium URHD0017]